MCRSPCQIGLKENVAGQLQGCFFKSYGYGPPHEKPEHHLLYLHYSLTLSGGLLLYFHK